MMRGEKLSAFALSEPGHGSDATHMDTTAEKHGEQWVIDGQKAYISKGAAADFLMVHARTNGEDGDVSGITSFLVDTDNAGLTLDKVQRPMGGQPGRQAILDFTDCRVEDRQVLGEVDEGFEQLIGWIGAGRLTIPAMAVGRAQWMLDRSLDYAKQRETFGQPIGEYQGVGFPLADLATDLEQARLLYRHAARKVDDGERAVKEQSMAKLRGSQLWNDAADVAIQTHGGAGFMRSLPFEAEYRESRAARIYEGTDEIQKRTITRELF
jgi:alkylation response protein AidB-like acyl-CoA dehydrogenase